MADATTPSAPVQTEIAAAPVAAPAAAPVEAKPAEKPAADVVDPAALKALEKQAKALAKELESTKSKAAEADALREAIANALGLGKKADPAEAITALQEKLRQREAKVARAILVESVRKSGIDFAQGVDPDDVLSLMGSSDDAVDVDAFALKSPDDFKARLDSLLERKPYLRAPPPAPQRGLPSAPAQPQAAAPTKKQEPAPTEKRRFGASSWFGGSNSTN